MFIDAMIFITRKRVTKAEQVFKDLQEEQDYFFF